MTVHRRCKLVSAAIYANEHCFRMVFTMFCVQYSFLLTLALLCPVSSAGAESVGEYDLVNSLDRVLDFLISDSHNVDVDCLFGVVLAEAQLNELLRKPLVVSKFRQIQGLRDKCRKLFDTVRSNIAVPNDEYAKILRKVLRVEAWQRDVKFTDGVLQYLPVLLWLKDKQFLAQVMYEGSPSESESDTCIVELVDQSPVDSPHTCTPSSACDEAMLQLDPDVHGYQLTHKLLYVQVARSLNCSFESTSFQTSTDILCSRILQEFHTIQVLNSPLVHDLYLEQMVLCGAEGYAEFLQPPVPYFLVQWQHDTGCYGHTDNTNNSGSEVVEQPAGRVRTKRNSVPMSNGCESHMTGLATAALALNLRYLHRRRNA